MQLLKIKLNVLYTNFVLNLLVLGILDQYTFGCGHDIATNFTIICGFKCTIYQPSKAPMPCPTSTHLFTPKEVISNDNSSSNISILYARLFCGLSESPKPFKSKAITLNNKIIHRILIANIHASSKP